MFEFVLESFTLSVGKEEEEEEERRVEQGRLGDVVGLAKAKGISP